MGSRLVYQTIGDWFEQIRKQMSLGKWQALNLAMLSLGIVLARTCTLSIVAEKLWALGKADSIERRMQRFLSNSRVSMEECSVAWTRWVLTHLHSCSSRSSQVSRVILLVDETKLSNHLSIMVVALAYRKRAIPLTWRCYHQENWPCSQLELICSLLKRIASGMPDGVVPLVQADRGIGTSPQLAKAVEEMGWHYLFRVQDQCRFWEEGTEKQEAKALKELARRGGCYFGCGRVFKKAAKEKREGAWLHCRVLVKWSARFEGPWCLITNCPYVMACDYAVRVWQEESFRDLKSGGWQWQRSHIWKPDHAERLLLAMSIAYAFTLSLGTAAIRTGKQAMQQITRGHRHHFSVFRLGLRYLSYLLTFTPSNSKPLSLRFLLIPHHPLC